MEKLSYRSVMSFTTQNRLNGNVVYACDMLIFVCFPNCFIFIQNMLNDSLNQGSPRLRLMETDPLIRYPFQDATIKSS